MTELCVGFPPVLPHQRVDCSLRYVTSTVRYVTSTVRYVTSTVRYVTSTVRYPLVSLSLDAPYVVAVSWRSGSTSYRLVHTLL